MDDPFDSDVHALEGLIANLVLAALAVGFVVGIALTKWLG